MPKIDGWRFCRLLRSPSFTEYNSSPIVVVVSATSSDTDTEEVSAQIGANAFLSAPDEAALRQLARDLLRGMAPTRSAPLLLSSTAARRRGSSRAHSKRTVVLSSRLPQHGGLGLGLFIVQKLVTAHNGHVEIRSRPKQVSCFSVFLPLGDG